VLQGIDEEGGHLGDVAPNAPFPDHPNLCQVNVSPACTLRAGVPGEDTFQGGYRTGPFHLQGSASGNVLAVSVGTVQASVTDGTFGSDAPGIVIHSSGSTAVHKVDNFQATLH
jgi:hypothetical protein